MTGKKVAKDKNDGKIVKGVKRSTVVTAAEEDSEPDEEEDGDVTETDTDTDVEHDKESDDKAENVAEKSKSRSEGVAVKATSKAGLSTSQSTKKKKKSATTTEGEKRPTRLSAATLKIRMSPALLQNPINRKKIWTNVMQMMVRRGYEWVKDREPPSEFDQLWPNNKGFLGFFHMHAVHSAPQSLKREKVYVVFCSKAGEPTLKSIQYPSRHVIVVSDSLTGRAKAALLTLAVKSPPNDKPRETLVGPNGVKLDLSYEFKDVFVEAFSSTSFMFDLLNQRYLKVVKFKQTSTEELETVFDTYERKKDVNHFPKMLDIDPVVKHLRTPVNAVLKISRLSVNSAVHNTFRLVTKANPDAK